MNLIQQDQAGTLQVPPRGKVFKMKGCFKNVDCAVIQNYFEGNEVWWDHKDRSLSHNCGNKVVYAIKKGMMNEKEHSMNSFQISLQRCHRPLHHGTEYQSSPFPFSTLFSCAIPSFSAFFARLGCQTSSGVFKVVPRSRMKYMAGRKIFLCSLPNAQVCGNASVTTPRLTDNPCSLLVTFTTPSSP